MNNTAIPAHIAIIMDGNRRWAREHGLSVLAGHQKVADTILEPLVEYAAKRGVKFITFWAFSTENWQREASEVDGIMRIFRHVIRKRWQRLHEKGVRVRVIGDMSKFAPDIRQSLEKVVEQTKGNTKITAIFALNYGGRDEVLRATKRLTADVMNRSPSLNEAQKISNNITIEQYNNYFDTTGIPDPDLIIRTGGEQRLSGFLLWQSEYSELYFPSFYMPEFTLEKLDEAIEEYCGRKRRFGK